MSKLDSDFLEGNILKEISELKRRVKELERALVSGSVITAQGMQYVVFDTSLPPTDSELDDIFGAPAVVDQPFEAILINQSLGTTVWSIKTDGESWFYEQYTLAV